MNAVDTNDRLTDGRMKKRTKPYAQMNAKELAAATARFDKEFIIDRSREPTPAERQQWRRPRFNGPARLFCRLRRDSDV